MFSAITEFNIFGTIALRYRIKHQLVARMLKVVLHILRGYHLELPCPYSALNVLCLQHQFNWNIFLTKTYSYCLWVNWCCQMNGNVMCAEHLLKIRLTGIGSKFCPLLPWTKTATELRNLMTLPTHFLTDRRWCQVNGEYAFFIFTRHPYDAIGYTNGRWSC